MRSYIFYINIAYLQFNNTLHSISVEEAFILVGASDFFYLLGFGSSLAHLNFNKQLYGQTHPNHANQHVHDYEQQFVLLAIQLLLAP
jgi:hypothetical protein